MFQITTGDGWVTDIVRPMNTGMWSHDVGINFFFIAYYLVTNTVMHIVIIVAVLLDILNIQCSSLNLYSNKYDTDFAEIQVTNTVMLNIVVAVLLDEFVNTTQQSKDELAAKAMLGFRVSHPLDPFLEQLIQFTTESDLCAKIQSLYGMLDQDDNGGIGYVELQEGLRKLSHGADGTEMMRLSPDEFSALVRTPYGNYCDDEGEISRGQFDGLLRHELTLYVQRQLALGNILEETRCSSYSTTLATLRGMQHLVHEQQQQQARRLEKPGAGMPYLPQGQVESTDPCCLGSKTMYISPSPRARRTLRGGGGGGGGEGGGGGGGSGSSLGLQAEEEKVSHGEEEASGKMIMAHVEALEAKVVLYYTHTHTHMYIYGYFLCFTF